MSDKSPNSNEKLSTLFETIYKPGFSTLGHGTTEFIAKKIIINGLESRSNDLQETAIPLMDYSKSAADQDTSIFTKPWPHRNYRCIAIIQIPNPKEDQSGGRHYFNGVFEDLPEDRKVDIGIQGIDKSYYIPPNFIQGYINLDTLEFIENPRFNPPPEVQTKEVKTVRLGQTSSRGKIKPVIDEVVKLEDDEWVF